MARRKRDDDRPQLDHPGLPPLLKGHLRPGGQRANESAGDADGGQATRAAAENGPADQASSTISAQPAEDMAASPDQANAVSGKATKSPADIATRPHLEGAEQGPR